MFCFFALTTPSPISFRFFCKKKIDGEEITEQQKLGQKISELLKKGKAITEELYIDTIFERINFESQNSENTNGWILDGFPNNLEQAKRFEEKLTGYKEEKAKKGGKVSKKKPSKVAPPTDEVNTDPIPSGIDIVFFMNAEQSSHDTLIDRAKGRLIDKSTNRVFHIKTNPPPNDEAIKVITIYIFLKHFSDGYNIYFLFDLFFFVKCSNYKNCAFAQFFCFKKKLHTYFYGQNSRCNILSQFVFVYTTLKYRKKV